MSFHEASFIILVWNLLCDLVFLIPNWLFKVYGLIWYPFSKSLSEQINSAPRYYLNSNEQNTINYQLEVINMTYLTTSC